MKMPNLLKMKRAISLGTILLLSASLLGGCSANQPQEGSNDASSGSETVVVTDMLGRTVDVPTSIDRVVGLGPGSLRLLSYMECVDNVVGVELSEQTDELSCPYRHVYQEAFAELPVIGDGGSKGVTPNEEALLQAHPQVIFANIDADSADTLQKRTGIPVVALTSGEAVFDEEVYESIDLVGKIMGKGERASELIAFMKDAESDLDKRTSKASEDSSATAYAGAINYRGGHGFNGTEAEFAPFLTTHVTNIADVDGMSGTYDIDLEAVSSSQPDYIFLDSINIGLVEEDVKANPQFFESLEAVKSGKVNTLIPYRFYATNIELAIADCYQVGSVMYPDEFSDIDPKDKLNEITSFFLGQDLYEEFDEAKLGFNNLNLLDLA